MIASPVLIPLIAAVFLAVNMGGSGAAVAFSPAYGADLIRRDLIPGLFGLSVLVGALVAGTAVTETIGRGIVPEPAMTLPVVAVVLVSIGVSLLIANLLHVPQSTSQSTVASLLGVGVALGNTRTGFLLTFILPAWVIMPILAYGLTHFLGAVVTGTLLLLASVIGIPSALAQLNVGAIIGLGSFKHGPKTMLTSPAAGQSDTYASGTEGGRYEIRRHPRPVPGRARGRGGSHSGAG